MFCFKEQNERKGVILLITSDKLAAFHSVKQRYENWNNFDKKE